LHSSHFRNAGIGLAARFRYGQDMTRPTPTERLDAARFNADRSGIARAAALLRAGALVAFGTETVYGLGADATNERAVARIFEAKLRPRFNPLICHYPDAEAAARHVAFDARAWILTRALWPGPLSLVLPRRNDCPVALLTGAGLDTLAVRAPANVAAQALLRAAARPIAAPSANRSGQVSPTTADHVLHDLDGRIDAVLDCGPCPVGVESTVLDLSGEKPFLLRPGGATVEAIEALIGPVGHGPAGSALRSPGMLASHYAPQLPVRLNAQTIAANEALLAFGPPLPGAGAAFQLSLARDLIEAAARLFSGLRHLDAEGNRLGLLGIAAMPILDAGLGLAINDRLTRAAEPRLR
jgi:L-threonylcarbamoyladenylate synthase